MTAQLSIILDANTITASPHTPDVVPTLIARPWWVSLTLETRLPPSPAG
jgi:hypothetical protein